MTSLTPSDIQNLGPEALRKIRAELARRSLAEYTRQMWPIIEPGAPLVWGWVPDAICDHLQAVAEGHIKRLVINVPPGSMKALDGDTPVLTAEGWKRHADLFTGDLVYGPDGKFKRVIASTVEREDECYEIEFDTGEKIIAGAAHEWKIERDYWSRKTTRSRRTLVVETRNLRCPGGNLRQDRVPLPKPIRGIRQLLPIDPYIFGAWLGDGSSDAAYLHVGEQDIGHFGQFGRVKLVRPREGRNDNFYRVYIEGLQIQLRALDVFKNKHIPETYLHGDFNQRLALLQGLLDTDGHVDMSACIFTNKNRDLAEGCAYLARSLGCKVKVFEKNSWANGVAYGKHWSVRIRCPKGIVPFRLKRKLDRVKYINPDDYRSGRSSKLYIKSVTPVGKRLVKCIEVDDGVYLAGKSLIPTHNSKLTAVALPSWMWTFKPHHKFLTSSYALSLAERNNIECRRVLQSKWYNDSFGISISPEEGGKVNFSTTSLGAARAISVGGQTTGYRGDLFIIDDPHDVSKVESDAKRAEAVQWFIESAQTRLNSLVDSTIVVVMQRVHEEDVTSVALEMGYEHLCIPMRWDEAYRKTTSIGWTDPRTTTGDLMWPERFPATELDTLERNMGAYAVASQMQQHPAPRKGGLFAVDRLIEMDDLPTDDTYSFVRAWDLAGSEGSGAYSVGVLMAYGHTRKRYYICDVVRGQWGGGKVRQKVNDTADADGIETAIVLPQDPGQAGKVLVEDMIAGLAGYNARAEIQSGSKETRAEPFAAQVEIGNVVVLNRVWKKTFVDELRFFPKGKFKDQVDASASAFNKLSSTMRKRKRTSSLAMAGEKQDNLARLAG